LSFSEKIEDEIEYNFGLRILSSEYEILWGDFSGRNSYTFKRNN
jgi:hypothetical protein